MKYIELNGTELKFSQIVLGTDHFGTKRPKEEAFKMMDAYRERGGNVFDTARVYGAWVEGGDGASEGVVGEYLKSRGCRGNMIISSKAGHPHLSDMHKSRLSELEIEEDINKGLSIMNIEAIDILWLHRDDINIPAGQLVEILNKMLKKGKIRSFGVSNWKTERIREANEYAEKNGLVKIAASQIQHSLVRCEKLWDDTMVQMDKTEEKFYVESRMPVFAYSSQGKGFFEKYDKNTLDDKTRSRYLCEANEEIYKKLKKLSGETGLSLNVLSLKWLMQIKEFDILPIIGGSKVYQIEESMKAAETAYIKELGSLIQ